MRVDQIGIQKLINDTYLNMSNQQFLGKEKIESLDQRKISESQQNTSNNVQTDLKEHKRFDTFVRQSDFQAVGVYELSRDEEGNPVIKFDGFSESDSLKSSKDNKKSEIVKTTINTDAVEREIEKLKKALSEIKKKLSNTNDPREKELLENKLAQLETELRQKDTDEYRRQHGKIVEQRVVSRIGE